MEPYKADIAYKYQNLKLKLFKTNLHIKFNKICLRQNLIPNYAKIKIKDSSRLARKTEQYASTFRIKGEIKFLYSKKISLNSALYKSQLELYNKVHPALIDSIIEQINKCITNKIKLHKHKQAIKISHLINSKCKGNVESTHNFYPRIINTTDVTLTDAETKLISKGLNYNFPPNLKNKHNLIKEIIEAESVIKNIPDPDKQNEIRILINNNFNKTIKNKNNNHIQNKFNYTKAQHEQRIACLLYTSRCV